MGLILGEAEMVAIGKIGWRQRLESLCSARSLEQEEGTVWK